MIGDKHPSFSVLDFEHPSIRMHKEHVTSRVAKTFFIAPLFIVTPFSKRFLQQNYQIFPFDSKTFFRLLKTSVDKRTMLLLWNFMVGIVLFRVICERLFLHSCERRRSLLIYQNKEGSFEIFSISFEKQSVEPLPQDVYGGDEYEMD